MKNTKFRLSKELLGMDVGEDNDFEYSAIQDIKNPESTLVTWYEGEDFHKAEYETCDVESYFEEGSWVKVSENIKTKN